MKTNLKSTLATLSLTLLAAIIFFGCASNSGSSDRGTHSMNSSSKLPQTMPNSSMPNR